jgi:hypothetical protein
VFFIYHSYLLNDSEIDLFNDILNNLCIKNGFEGVHLVLNSFDKIYNGFTNFYVNFNYKKYESRYYDKENKQICLDYNTYINNNYHIKPNVIQTVVFDFNNKPRLYKPNRLQHSTICVNNTEINKTIFLNKLVETYNRTDKKSDVENIMLINSFNEWGENMTFEPSEKYEYYNLNLLFDYLDTF